MAPTLKPLHEQAIVITGASSGSGIGLVTARMAAVLGLVASRLTDRLMSVWSFTSQQSRTRHASGDHHRALFEAGYGGEERGTHEPHLLRRRSYYVKATKRPGLAAATLLIGGGFALALARRKLPTQPEPAPHLREVEEVTIIAALPDDGPHERPHADFTVA